MPAASCWKIPPGAADWECDWRGDQLFHLRHFRSFPLAEKIRAVEEMAQVAEYFRDKGKEGTRSESNERTTARSEKPREQDNELSGGGHAETQRR